MEINFKNPQRDVRLNRPYLGEIVSTLVETEFSEFEGEACFHLVSKKRMAEVNYEFLKHEGPTDVITFDLAEDPNRILFLAEIFICPGVAQEQAVEFNTTWQDELLRYHIHALLHLQGYDDLTPNELKLMKGHEERIMTKARDAFQIQKIGKD